MHDRRRAGQAYFALVVLTLLWGYSWIPMKIATRDASPFVVATVRSMLGAGSLLAFAALSGRSVRPPPFLPTLVLGLLQTALYTLVSTAAVHLGGAGNTAVLVYTMPFWLALLAWPILGQPIRGGRWAALLLAAVGLGLIVGPSRGGAATARLIAVLAGMIWATSAVFALRLQMTQRFELLSLTAWQMVWGSLAMTPVTLLWHGPFRLTTSFAVSIAFLGVASSAVGWALWLFILSRLPASVAGVASLGTPVVSVVSASLQLREIPSRDELLGIACVLLALIVNWRATAGSPRRRGDGKDG